MGVWILSTVVVDGLNGVGAGATGGPVWACEGWGV